MKQKKLFSTAVEVRVHPILYCLYQDQVETVQTLPKIFLPGSLKANAAIPPEAIGGSDELLTSETADATIAGM